jgi:hypothetical protein
MTKDIFVERDNVNIRAELIGIEFTHTHSNTHTHTHSIREEDIVLLKAW